MSALEQRILAAGDAIARIVGRLRALEYEFGNPDGVLPGPEPGTEAAIARIEREVGPLPLALKLFWRHVGSVDLTGRPPAGWDGCEYPDPLVVAPPSHAVVELKGFLADRAERLRRNYPYVVPIAPDEYHKADASGGMFYNVSVPAAADDPRLNDERHTLTFVAYLELAVRWGGFPGLDRCRDRHTWPLAALRGTTPPRGSHDRPTRPPTNCGRGRLTRWPTTPTTCRTGTR